MKPLMAFPAEVWSNILPPSISFIWKSVPLNAHLGSFPAKLANCDEMQEKHLFTGKFYSTLLIGNVSSSFNSTNVPGTWHKYSGHPHHHLQFRYGGPRQWSRTQLDQKYSETPWKFGHEPMWQKVAGARWSSSLPGSRTWSAMMMESFTRYSYSNK